MAPKTCSDHLQHLGKLLPESKDVKFDDDIQECEVCMLAKKRKLLFRERRDGTKRSLERIYTDIMGPITLASFPGRSNT